MSYITVSVCTGGVPPRVEYDREIDNVTLNWPSGAHHQVGLNAAEARQVAHAILTLVGDEQKEEEQP